MLQEQQPPTQTTTMKKFIFFFLGLIFFLLATSAITLRKSQTQSTSPTSELNITPTPKLSQTPTLITDMSDWKKHSNERFGYEFKYPSKYTYQDSGDHLSPSSRSKSIGSLTDPKIQTNIFSVWAKQTEASLEDYIELRNICTKSTYSCQPTTPGSIPNSLRILTNEGRYSRVFTFVKHEDLLFEFSHQAGLINEQFLATYNQILSTFTFSSPKLLTIDWSKYSNTDSWMHFNSNFKVVPERRFSFSYPNILTIKNQDSGSVSLSADYSTYLSIEQVPSINSFSENSFDQKLKTLFKTSNYSPLDSNNFTMIINEDDLIVYRIEVNGQASCSLVDVFESPNWNCYIISIRGNGLAVSEIRPIPESIIIDLIKTIQFI